MREKIFGIWGLEDWELGTGVGVGTKAGEAPPSTVILNAVKDRRSTNQKESPSEFLVSP